MYSASHLSPVTCINEYKNVFKCVLFNNNIILVMIIH